MAELIVQGIIDLLWLIILMSGAIQVAGIVTKPLSGLCGAVGLFVAALVSPDKPDQEG